MEREYVAGFKDRKIQFKAESLYAAKQEANRQFKPSKKDAGLVWVELADTPISTSSIG